MNGTIEQSTAPRRHAPVIIGLALGLGAFMAWYVYMLDIQMLLVDQASHLNISRQIVDSLTPGITQFGFWPPLLHAFMIPFVSIDSLYQSGLAGAFTLIPFLAIGAFFLYKLIVRVTDNRLIGALGAASFLLNPYLLYYAATPMMEVLFISLIVGAAYFLTEWMYRQTLGYLMATAFFIALASLARFEGLILIPLVGAVVFFRLLAARKRYHEIEAAAILFFFVAVLGAFAIATYGWQFGGDPFAFMNSEWSAYSQQRDYERPTEGKPLASLQYLLHASYYMIGWPQVWIALIAFLAVIFFSRQRLPFLAASLVLMSPLIFDLFALYRGNIILYVDELPPYDWFYNERYGLYWIGFTAFTPMALAGLQHLKSIEASSGVWKRLWYTVTGATKLSLGGIIAVTVLAANVLYFSEVAFIEKFSVVKESAKRYPVESQMGVVRALKERYDHGKIFTTRHDYVVVSAGIPLSSYIYESNYRYFDQTLERPWLFARWVVMLNNDTKNQNTLIPNWSRSNERISLTWGDSPVFRRYYNLIYENTYERVYQLNEAAVVEQYVLYHRLDRQHIPSLNPELARWNPETIYREMGGQAFVDRDDANLDSTPPAETAKVSSATVKAAAGVHEYRVQKGETLWDIAAMFYGDGALWERIATENNVKKPYRIYPNQILRIAGNRA